MAWTLLTALTAMIILTCLMLMINRDCVNKNRRLWGNFHDYRMEFMANLNMNAEDKIVQLRNVTINVVKNNLDFMAFKKQLGVSSFDVVKFSQLINYYNNNGNLPNHAIIQIMQGLN